MAVDYTSVTMMPPGQMSNTPGIEYQGKFVAANSDGTITIAPVSSATVMAYLGQGWLLTAFTK